MKEQDNTETNSNEQNGYYTDTAAAAAAAAEQGGNRRPVCACRIYSLSSGDRQRAEMPLSPFEVRLVRFYTDG